MEHLIIGLAAVAAAGLTFFSGFGLGTLLLPVFALFFSVELAVALTAVVHFLNNALKLVLLGRYAERRTLVSFGALAIAGAYGGAEVLLWLSDFEPLATYRLGGLVCRVTPVKMAVSAVLIAFTLVDVVPQLRIKAFGRSHLVMGGLLSGFFGGLSGHQGALRSAFLIRAGLTKEQFLGTSVVLACLVDAARLLVYAAGLSWEGTSGGDRRAPDGRRGRLPRHPARESLVAGGGVRDHSRRGQCAHRGACTWTRRRDPIVAIY